MDRAGLPLGMMSVALSALMLAAAYWDIRARRIPNVLTIVGFAVAIALRLAAGPGAGIDGLVGAILAFVLCLPFFVLGVLGGGDVKLLMALGAFMGPRDLLVAMLIIASLGGIIGAVGALRKGILLPVLYNCGDIIKHWATFGRRGSNRSLASTGALAIPYGVAIAVGSLVWWFAQVRTL
ncbi:MAG: prepilin peptidase [Gemmatimonadales bacterium]